MNVKQIINQFNHTKSNTGNNDKTFSDIINYINKGNEHLLTYFKTFKNDYINQLKGQINKIESAYEDSINRNMDMLSFIQLLIDNYDGSVEMKNSIMNNKLKIYQCKEIQNFDELIKYYNEYNIVEDKKKINIEDFRCVKNITDQSSPVHSLLLLKDKRVASCSEDKTIRIYDPSKDYHCDQVIQRHTKAIISICELDDGTIVSCSYDKSIMIGDYTSKNAHDDWIFKVIAIPNNRMASCSDDATIKIWKSSKTPYSDKPIKVLEGHRLSINSLLYIKREIL